MRGDGNKPPAMIIGRKNKSGILSLHPATIINAAGFPPVPMFMMLAVREPVWFKPPHADVMDLTRLARDSLTAV